ncbi:MAG: response regulator [Elusimicrobia bacterium]|nr:response regulator [Elusimicrobiota bacterium]
MFKVLIIDDEPDMCRGLSDILEEEGFSSLTAHDGKAGLEKVKNEEPDLVILDLRLPEMDGIQVLKKIKKINSSIPVVMITGYEDIKSAVEATRFGILDYITKPFDNEKVVSLVKKTLQTPARDRSKGIMREELLAKLKTKGIPEKVIKPSPKEQPDKTHIRKKSSLRLKRIHIIFALVLIGSTVIIITRIKKDASYSSPSMNPSEIMWDGKYLWSCDWYNQKIFKHNMDNSLSIVKTYQFHDIHPIAVCLAGDYIWSCDVCTGKIYVHKLNENLPLVASYKSPSVAPSGLAWDGKNLWSCDADSDKIYKHKIDNKLSVIDVYASPSTNPSGLAWDGKNLWSCDSDSNKIYKHKMDATLSVGSWYSLSVYSSKKSKLTGLTLDDNYIWTVDEANKKIHRHSLFKMKISKIFKYE